VQTHHAEAVVVEAVCGHAEKLGAPRAVQTDHVHTHAVRELADDLVDRRPEDAFRHVAVNHPRLLE
jgi:hypothetical protein